MTEDRSNTHLLDIAELSVDVPDVGTIVDNVSFTLDAGESLGLVGESGAGKSMTARAVAGLLSSDYLVRGEMRFESTPLIGKGANRSCVRAARRRIGTIFQDARSHLNPRQRIGDFLLEPTIGRNRGKDTTREALDLLDRVGLSNPPLRMRQYPHELSGGMLQRVMIASVALARPSLVLADEPTTALDATTQAEVIEILGDLRQGSGTAIIFITHDLDLAAQVCDRIAVMYAGAVVEIRSGESLSTTPQHPYTRALFDARPDVHRRFDELKVIPGQPISTFDASRGCAFAPRCVCSVAACTESRPVNFALDDGLVRCIRPAHLREAAT